MDISGVTLPIRVGIMGTGYAAKRRAEAIQADSRSQLIGVCGHRLETTAAFAQTFACRAFPSLQALLAAEVDLVMIANINQLHGETALAALTTGKHVVMEYPLALTVAEGEALVQLAAQQKKLLHVEHIELLGGGVHQALKQALPQLGTLFAGEYRTYQMVSPAPQRWKYHHQQFGFPLIAAASRISRFLDVLGDVKTVTAQSQFWPSTDPNYFRACLCNAQLQFTNGALVNLSYGKGEVFSCSERTLTLHGEQGSLQFLGEQGSLFKDGQETTLTVGGRRGLFQRDTEMVLKSLTTGTPLYTTAIDSLKTLKVAESCYSASQNQSVESLD